MFPFCLGVQVGHGLFRPNNESLGMLLCKSWTSVVVCFVW